MKSNKNLRLSICILLPAALCLLPTGIFAQTPGEWTWMNGGNTTNSPGVYGTQGVPSPNNTPPALYEACEWTDLQGNFWLFGGLDFLWKEHNDLWKYNPITNEWTWVKGSGISLQFGVYGTQGVPSTNNNPGGRAWGALTWTDTNGDFWLFGGGGASLTQGAVFLGDLWKYHISTNEWTWMGGNSDGPYGGNYGTQGISSPTNLPPGRSETSCAWTDNNNNLWLFGGYGNYGNYFYNDLWKYNISTNEWTWMKGSNTWNQLGVYGVKGIEDPANTPGARLVYSRWKDNNGDLWLFAGEGEDFLSMYNDVWKYTISTNDWTWMYGSNMPNDTGNADLKCIPSVDVLPGSRYENRACWSDDCGNFWTFGGQWSKNDLWHLNPNTGEWTFVSGSLSYHPPGNFGIKTISSPNNIPGGESGAVSWKDNSGNLWLFGGENGNDNWNTLWRYVPDPTCVAVCNSFALSVTITSISVSCNGANTGTATGTVSGGTPPFTYLWSPGGQTTPTITGLAAGIYTVTVTDATGNTTTATVTITQPASISGIVNTTSTTCGSNTGTATISANGGTGSFTYLWSGGQTTATINNLGAGSYSVTVTDASGCTQIVSGTVASAGGPTVTVNNASICAGQTANLTANGATTYSWSAGALTTGTNTANVSPLITTTYTLTGITAGCSNTAISTVTVYSAPSVSAGADVTISPGSSTPLNATGGGTYSWSPATGLSCTNCANPVSSPSSTIDYCVTVTDANGCIDSACVTVRVIAESPCPSNDDYTVPTAFSPNNDGHNDLFILHGFENCITTFSLIIFDRWGEKVFETTDASKGWDGNYHGKPMNAAVFVYSIKATLISGEKITKKGNVSLIR